MDKKEILCRSQKENYIFDEFSYYVDKKAYANAYLAILIYSGIACIGLFPPISFHRQSLQRLPRISVLFCHYLLRSFFPEIPAAIEK